MSSTTYPIRRASSSLSPSSVIDRDPERVPAGPRGEDAKRRRSQRLPSAEQSEMDQSRRCAGHRAGHIDIGPNGRGAESQAMTGSDVVGGLVLQLTSQLRSAGVPVSTGEAMDAASALDAVQVSTLKQVRAALRATLIKRQNDIETFERAFDALTRASIETAALRNPSRASSEGTQPSSPGAGASTQLLEELLAALQTDDAAALSVLAAQAVDQLAGIGAGARDSERAFLYRVLRGLDLANLLQQAMRNHVPDCGRDPRSSAPLT